MRSHVCFVMFALSACGAGTQAPAAADFPSDALSTVTSDKGALSVEVRTSPQPPQRGIISAQLTVTDDQGTRADGLEMAVQAWMPTMGHGATNPVVEAQGNGVYLLHNVNLYMPGSWELRVTVDGAASDLAQVKFDVP